MAQHQYHYFNVFAFKHALLESSHSISSLAIELGYHRTKMQYVAGGWIPPEDMRNTIAMALHTKAETLWPLVTSEITKETNTDRETDNWGNWERDDEIVVDE